jgi:hypothetical protein
MRWAKVLTEAALGETCHPEERQSLYIIENERNESEV